MIRIALQARFFHKYRGICRNQIWMLEETVIQRRAIFCEHSNQYRTYIRPSEKIDGVKRYDVKALGRFVLKCSLFLRIYFLHLRYSKPNFQLFEKGIIKPMSFVKINLSQLMHS